MRRYIFIFQDFTFKIDHKVFSKRQANFLVKDKKQNYICRGRMKLGEISSVCYYNYLIKNLLDDYHTNNNNLLVRRVFSMISIDCF